jgi:hypothetical protein
MITLLGPNPIQYIDSSPEELCLQKSPVSRTKWPGFSLYNAIMKQLLEQRILALSHEIQQLDDERRALAKRDSEIEVRLHQAVGAIYELQQLIADLDRQASEEALMDLEAVEGLESQLTHPSESGDLNNHPGQPIETGKNNPQQS